MTLDEFKVDPPKEENLKAADEYINAELTSGWAKKASIETRAFAIVAVNTGLATLYIAVQAQFGISSISLPEASKALLVAGLFCSLASIAGAAVAAGPGRYKEPSSDFLTQIFENSMDPQYIFTRAAVIKARIDEFQKLAHKNTQKARLIGISFILLGFFTAFLILALFIAVLWPSKV